MTCITENMMWYTRRAGAVRGPFTAEYVARYILLGRIGINDELSQDRQSWRAVMECTELFPDEFSALSNWDDYQKLIMARISVDERRGQRRRPVDGAALAGGQKERRHLPDRRKVDRNLETFIMHMFGKAGQINNRQQGTSIRVFLLATLLVTIVVAWFSAVFR